MPTELPTFDRPPLTEVFLALQHDPLSKLDTVRLAEFLLSRGPAWEPIAETTGVGQTREPVDEAPEWVLPRTLEIDFHPGVRMRASSGDRDRMLQVENGWLALNWMVGADRPYPRYDQLRAEFLTHLAAWKSFLQQRGLGDPRPNLWEIGYVNVFPRGGLWEKPGDWPAMLPTLFQPGPVPLGSLQTSSGRWAYLIAPGIGRIQIILEHALRGGPAPVECVVVRLVARGPIDDGAMATAMHGFDLAHEKIVTTFVSLLSDSAKRELGYRP